MRDLIKVAHMGQLTKHQSHYSRAAKHNYKIQHYNTEQGIRPLQRKASNSNKHRSRCKLKRNSNQKQWAVCPHCIIDLKSGDMYKARKGDLEYNSCKVKCPGNNTCFISTQTDEIHLQTVSMGKERKRIT